MKREEHHYLFCGITLRARARPRRCFQPSRLFTETPVSDRADKLDVAARRQIEPDDKGSGGGGFVFSAPPTAPSRHICWPGYFCVLAGAFVLDVVVTDIDTLP
jgi:hypothetical protein